MRLYRCLVSILISTNICSCSPLPIETEEPWLLEEDGAVHLELTQEKQPDLRISDFLISGDPAQLKVAITNRALGYVARVGMGTPPQYVNLTVDTGSSDLWVAASAQVSPEFFDPIKSSSYYTNNTAFVINNSKGAGSGVWATETIKMGSLTVTNQLFGTLNTSFSTATAEGILGLGPMLLESALTPTYPNFCQKLKDQGLIAKNVFSVFLNTWNKSNGSLLFGAVDSSKYVGQLYTVSMSPTHHMDISLSKIQVNGVDITWTPSWLPLDTGTTITFLPPDVFISIASRINNLHYIGGAFFADSTNFDYNQSIVFDFSGAQIIAPIRDMMVHSKDIFLPSADIPANYDQVLGIFPNSASNGQNILGSTFLRSAYVVFDLESFEISLAQANIDTYPPFWPPATQNATKPVITPVISSVPGAKNAPLRPY